MVDIGIFSEFHFYHCARRIDRKTNKRSRILRDSDLGKRSIVSSQLLSLQIQPQRVYPKWGRGSLRRFK